MIKSFLLTLFIIKTVTGIAQLLDDRVDKYVVQNSIDSFMVYSFPCSGCLLPLDSCYLEESHYLIWKQNGRFFLKRFDYCKTYKTLSLDTANPLTFYFRNKRIIDKEQIYQPTYYEYRKNKNKIDTLFNTTTVDHSCYHTFQLSLTKKSKSKSADIYDLDFKLFDNGKKNIYYTYNQKTKFKALIDLTTKLIKQLETNNEFEVE